MIGGVGGPAAHWRKCGRVGARGGHAGHKSGVVWACNLWLWGAFNFPPPLPHPCAPPPPAPLQDLSDLPARVAAVEAEHSHVSATVTALRQTAHSLSIDVGGLEAEVAAMAAARPAAGGHALAHADPALHLASLLEQEQRLQVRGAV